MKIDLRVPQSIIEDLMIDSCIIQREVEGSGAWNASTGTYANNTLTSIYEGKCLFRTYNGSQTTQAGQDQVVFQTSCFTPLAADHAEEGDRLTLTTVGSDPSQEGRMFVVLRNMVGTYLVAQELVLEDRQDAEGFEQKR